MVTLEQTTYLGPATVLLTVGDRVKVELPDERAWARLALGWPYRPAPGDEVLALGRAGNWYVMGVLGGRGPTILTAPGDLELRAPHGRVTVVGGQGVEVRGPEVTVAARRLELLARTAVERFGRAARWVSGAFQLRAGRVRTRVEGEYDLHAGRLLERADGDVKIDGSKIDLG